MQFTEQEYLRVRETAKELYGNYGPVKCPAINSEYVHFTSEGFNHILYRINRHPRSKQDQYMRFQILDLARRVVQISTTFQEYEEKLQDVVIDHRGKKEKATKFVKYWGFIAILKKKKIKVIVRRIGEGKILFWSVIPFWRTTKHGDHVFKDFASGNLIED